MRDLGTYLRLLPRRHLDPLHPHLDPRRLLSPHPPHPRLLLLRHHPLLFRPRLDQYELVVNWDALLTSAATSKETTS